jgi:PepSY-associated transmembrane protein
MRTLVLIHRWLGVAFCLFFAMWFASGMVMHFVPFPSLSEAERIHGLAVIGSASPRHDPAAAVKASGIADATRVRLYARIDGLVYLVQGGSGVSAVYASDLAHAGVQNARRAFDIAIDHARRRGLNATSVSFADLASHDQWTVPNALDVHRPLFRIRLNDDAATELYVSSTTGEVVCDTTRSERLWNYAGSIVHWIYPTALRRDWRAWDTTVWTLSLIAIIAAITGTVLGLLRVRVTRCQVRSPYHGWHAWHHWLGMACMVFILTWIVSGWLSMDHGRLFSTGRLSGQEAFAFTGEPRWETLSSRIGQKAHPVALETEWFAFGGRIYRRDRLGLAAQRLSIADEPFTTREFLERAQVDRAATRLATECRSAVAVNRDDYPAPPSIPGAPVYRVVCGDVWFHIDGASGALLERLDSSRRAYRWLYSALHTLDFPGLAARPRWRTAVILALCSLGLAFCATAVVIGWRRLRNL